MQLIVTTGTGEGPTPLAAFDAALINAGVANYNLVLLSSVIPTGSVIRRAKFMAPPDEYGHRLYVVISHHEKLVPGEMACAGLGWVQYNNDGRGLFVELQGANGTEVKRAIHITLESMMINRQIPYNAIESEIVGIECHKLPVCALVMAVYKSEGWVNL